jgi:hypothetical protein
MEEGQGTSSENIAAIRSYKNQVAAKAMGTILAMTGVDPDSELGHAIKMFAAGAQSDSDGQSKGTGANTAIERILQDMEANEKMSR